jgi:hypothetical protein
LMSQQGMSQRVSQSEGNGSRRAIMKCYAIK